jgi:mono/diheme cytochrome c family protein
MPRVPLTEQTVELIASYLAQREPTSPEPRLAPPSSSAEPTSVAGAAGLYGRHCAACHGVAGRADGPNAKFLPVRPTMHADSAYMSRRSDDALFDATYGGGYIMNRSNRMPPFGQTLTRAQIWDLVRHLRTLCRCEGPAWSRN